MLTKEQKKNYISEITAQFENSKEEVDLDTIEGSLQNELGAVNANLGKLLIKLGEE